MHEQSEVLQLELQVPEILAQAAGDQVRRQVDEEVQTILSTLGANLSIKLTVKSHVPRSELAYGSDAVLAVSANGKRLFLRDGELERIVAYTQGSSNIRPIQKMDEVELWPHLVTAGESVVGDMLALLCRVVLGPQLAEVLTEHPLRELLNIGIPLPDTPSRAPESPAAFEELLDGLTPPQFELAIHPDYLRELNRADDRYDLFPYMWDGLFVELGIPQPATRMRLNSSLRARGFQFRTAGVTGVPWVGLGLEQMLVNDTSERLALMNVNAVPSMNPATRQPAAITTVDQKDFLEAAGLTTWDPWGYLILCCAAALRENAWRFMTLTVAEQMLDRLELAFPEVATAVRDVVPRGTLPRVLRELLFDQVSIRNLSAICETLARAWTDAGDTESDPVMLVRHRQRYAIADKVSRGTSTVVVYLLDPVFEVQDKFHPAVAATLRQALAHELTYLPLTAQQPAILTSDTRRRDVRHALRHRFPSMTVLGHSDIPPEWNVQPVARIAPM